MGKIRIIQRTQHAWAFGWSWKSSIAAGEIETVMRKTFETEKDAAAYYEEKLKHFDSKTEKFLIVDDDNIKHGNYLKPHSPYGYIDVCGQFYGCNINSHDLLAEFHFNSSEEELEMQGYVKVFRNNFGKVDFYCKTTPNEKQMDKIKEISRK